MILGSMTARQIEADKELMAKILKNKPDKDPRPCVTRKMTAEERKLYGLPEIQE